MEAKNPVLRMKELIRQISAANDAYFRDDNPTMTDREYDGLVAELKDLEATTGVVFSNSPTKYTAGSNKAELKTVTHTKPMLSAKKTKSTDEMLAFAMRQPVMLSWKLDGLSLVLRYRGGSFVQALTRGEHGIAGEDVTDTVKHLRNVPKKVGCKDSFEVRGEGVLSWADFRVLNRDNGQTHPRNVAAGAVRALVPSKGDLSHIDFIAFELILPGDERKTKTEQLDFLAGSGFQVVDHRLARPESGERHLRTQLASFQPEGYAYPVDGIIAEYEDLAFGRSLGATAHHENRMLALKWEDGLYETVFRGVDASATRNGMISLTALFDPVSIEGGTVRWADLHSLSNFEKFQFGIGDTIKVYKANMIIPQVAENVTKSGTYHLPSQCPCCGSRLELRVSAGGVKNLWCPNEERIARNAQKIARFCDQDAMNMDGFTAGVLEKLMAFGFIKSFADLYRLSECREQLLSVSGLGCGSCDRLISAVKKSRRCCLSQFLVAVGIPLMGTSNARSIDEYFCGSWEAFEKAIAEGFSFFHIAGISQALNRNIYAWYADEAEEKLWRPVLKEITFSEYSAEVGAGRNPFANTSVAVTRTVNGMNRQDITELLTLLGATVSESVTKRTDYLLVGAAPGTKKLSAALNYGTKIITEGHFAKMLSDRSIEGETVQ